MAPFLSFTAEEAWSVLGDAGKTPPANAESIFMDTYLALDPPDESLLRKWARIREVREQVNKDIETLRTEGKVGASLQAEVALTVAEDDHAMLTALGPDLKFVFITSAITLIAGSALSVRVKASNGIKCERCWHYVEAIGSDASHPTLCGRCASNLDGVGETRKFA